MDAESYRRLRAEFLRALELQGDARVAHVAGAFPDEPELRRELAGLVAASAYDDSFLDSSGLGVQTAEPPTALPERIGSYRVLGRLGRGGMGVVLLAEQLQPRREVALKLLRHGAVGPEGLRRFRREAELLGRLQHPGIAQVYESGTWSGPWGEQPFLALELVRGVTLTEFARVRALDRRARLELLASICDAVQHAHQKGVIHRDLKPANVLVDSEGRPRVLDFGVARLVQPESAVASFATRDAVLGTPAYMSPEQAGGEPLDTRSDVYSLGCIAYELLAGRVPIDVDSAGSLIEGLRAVREREPPLLGALDARLAGDVETIVAKALAKDPERRYASASDLAADVRRHLSLHPIAARPPTTAYLLSRFVRRQRALVAAASAVLVVLVLGLVGTLSGLARANREASRAAAEADEKRAVNDFLTSLFAAPDPEVDGRQVRVVDLLERWAAGLQGAFQDRPRVRAALLERLAATWRGLGLLEQAEPPLREALALRAGLGPPQDAERLATQCQLGVLLSERGQVEEARTLLGEAQSLRGKFLGPRHPDTLDAWANLAAVRMQEQRYDLAVPDLEQVVTALREVYGPAHEKTLVVENNLALALMYARRLDEAQQLFERVHLGWRSLAGDDHPTTIAALGNLAMLQQSRGNAQEAERLYREAAAAAERVLGPGHPGAMHALNNLVALLHDQQRFAEAEPIARHVLEVRRARLSSLHPRTLTSVAWHARLLDELGRAAESEALYEEALAGWDSMGARETDPALAVRTQLAGLRRASGDLDAAERLHREVERVRAAHPDPLDTDRFDNLGGLGRTLWLRGAAEEAEALLLEALRGRLAREFGDVRSQATVAAWLFELRADPQWQTREEPARVERLDALAADPHATQRDLALAECRLAAVLGARGLRNEAEELLLGAAERLRDDAPAAAVVWIELYLLYAAWPRADEAGRWRARLLATPEARRYGGPAPLALVGCSGVARAEPQSGCPRWGSAWCATSSSVSFKEPGHESG